MQLDRNLSRFSRSINHLLLGSDCSLAQNRTLLGSQQRPPQVLPDRAVPSFLSAAFIHNPSLFSIRCCRRYMLVFALFVPLLLRPTWCCTTLRCCHNSSSIRGRQSSCILAVKRGCRTYSLQDPSWCAPCTLHVGTPAHGRSTLQYSLRLMPFANRPKGMNQHPCTRAVVDSRYARLS